MRTFKSLLLIAVAGLAPASFAEPVSLASASCGARSFDVYFESWQASLNSEAQQQIRAQQTALAGCAIRRVRVVGMAGAPGDETDNQRISRQRADAIAAALQAGGWPRSAFEIVALGEQNASIGGVDQPMRRRVHVDVDAAAH